MTWENARMSPPGVSINYDLYYANFPGEGALPYKPGGRCLTKRVTFPHELPHPITLQRIDQVSDPQKGKWE